MSEWRERANKRRDERQTKAPAIRPPSGSKKNTKKWCRGKVSVEHKPVCVAYNDLKNVHFSVPDWKVLVCSECKKELDHWWPCTWFKEKRDPPAWVSRC